MQSIIGWSKAKWGVGVDAVYMALGSDVARPSANVDFIIESYYTRQRDIALSAKYLNALGVVLQFYFR